MCTEMKGNIFALKVLISYPDIVAIYFIFISGDVDNVTVIQGTQRKPSSSASGPVVQDLLNHVGAEM